MKRRQKWVSFMLFLTMTFVGIVGSYSYEKGASVVHAVGLVQMHRMYNPNSGEHFYTGNEAERDNLISVGWSYEGLGWTAPDSSSTPVYRVYNPNSGEHHYTINVAEKDMLVALGWNDEGIGWYSDDSETVPLYRLYNPNATGEQEAGGHHYTTNIEERDMLISLGWNDEGIGWYGAVAGISWDIPAESGVTSNFTTEEYDYSSMVVEREVSDEQICAVNTSGDSTTVLLDGSVDTRGVAIGKVLVVATNNMSKGAVLKITAMDTLPNGEISVTGVEPELYEVFDSIDLEGDVTASASSFAPEEGVVEVKNAQHNSGVTVEGLVKKTFKQTYKKDNFEVGAKLSITEVKAHVVIDGDFDLTSQSYEFKNAEVSISEGVDAYLECSLKSKSEDLYLKFGEFVFPLGQTPFFLSVDVGIDGEIGASAKIGFSANLKQGFSYSSAEGIRQIDEKKIEMKPLTVEGTIGVYLVLTPKISFCKAMDIVAIDIKAGVKHKATLTAHITKPYNCLNIKSNGLIQVELSKREGIGKELSKKNITAYIRAEFGEKETHYEDGVEVSKCTHKENGDSGSTEISTPSNTDSSTLRASQEAKNFMSEVDNWTPSYHWVKLGEKTGGYGHAGRISITSCGYGCEELPQDKWEEYLTWNRGIGIDIIKDNSYEKVNVTAEDYLLRHQQMEIEKLVETYGLGSIQNVGAESLLVGEVLSGRYNSCIFYKCYIVKNDLATEIIYCIVDKKTGTLVDVIDEEDERRKELYNDYILY